MSRPWLRPAHEAARSRDSNIYRYRIVCGNSPLPRTRRHARRRRHHREEARPEDARGQGALRHERAEARPARPRLRPAARGGPAEWRQHVLDLEQGYGPVDATEKKLVDAIAVAMWKEIRADRFEAEVLDRHPAAQPGPLPRLRPAGARPRGGADHGDPLPGQCRHGAHAAPCAPSSSTGRPSRPGCCCRRVHARTRRNDKKHERIIGSSLGRALPPSPPPGDPPPPAEPDPDAWLADVPVVEADPSDESLRRSLLGMIEHPILRADGDQGAAEEHRAADRRQRQRRLRGVVREAAEGAVRAGGPARKPQGRHRGGDQAQPALAARASISPTTARRCRRICSTRTTPTTRSRRPSRPRLAPPPGETIPSLRARLARLLDRSAPRLPEELDLAEAVCAIKWPKWPDYRGPIDLGLLRRALDGTVIDGPTLNWLGGKEIVRECAVGSDAR